MEIPGFRIEAVLAEGPDMRVWRATRGTGERVVVATPVAEQPGYLDMARLQRAFDLGRAAPAEAVLRPLEIVRQSGRIGLVAEDFDGVPLSTLLRNGGLRLASLLSTAHALAAALARLHASGLLVNDLHPGNVLVAHGAASARVMILGVAAKLGREGDTTTASAALTGPLAYCAPEKCRRMEDAAVDERADLYSLGVMLFELAAGAPPFSGTDAAALAHAHVAVPPPELQTLRSDVPAVCCEIVARLLRKDAADRYASAAGVAADLAECVSRFNHSGTVRAFAIAARDASSTFRIPAKLYGRDPHGRQFRDAFEQARLGRRTLVRVAGRSGTGKSAFVASMQEAIQSAGGWLCSGKFEEFQVDRPYIGVVKAFRQLGRDLLAAPEAILDAYRTALREAVGVHGALLTESLPELAAILGPQPPVEAAPHLDAARRFHGLVGRFCKAVATPGRPLVLFLDDLQWADQPSLTLLEGLASAPGLGHLMLVLGYRTNELTSGHPARGVMDALGADANDVTVEIGPLGREDIGRMVADTLRAEPAAVAPIVDHVHGVAAGNVFFARELLISLHKCGVFRFDEDARRWCWEVHLLARQKLPDTVGKILGERLSQLPADCLDLLFTAACIGSEFDLKTLSSAHETPEAQVAARLGSAVGGGLILALDANHEVLQTLGDWGRDGTAALPETTVRYRFQHDQVRLTVHDGQSDEERRHRHLRVGRLLYQTLAPDELSARAVAVFNHLSYGVDLVVESEERLAYARLGLQAGRLAQRALAFAAARRALLAAADLLGAEPWQRHYELALGIRINLAECALALEKTDELEATIDEVLRNVRDPVAGAAAYTLLIRIRTTQSRYAEAVDSAVRIARDLNVRLPRKPSMAHVLAGVARALLAQGRREPMAYENHPDGTDPKLVAAIDLLSNSANAAYFAEPNLLPLIATTCTRLSLRFGMAPGSSYGLAAWGLVLCGVLGRIQTGYEFGRLAVTIGRRHGGYHEARARFVFDCHIKHWKDPLRAAANELRRDFASNRDAGDEEIAVYSAGVSLYTSFLAGDALDADLRGDGMVEYLEASNKPHVKFCHLSWVQLHEALRAEKIPDDLRGRWFDLDERLPEFERTNNGVQIAISMVAAGVLDHLAGRFERAEERLARAAACEKFIVGQVLVPGLAFFRALNAFRLYERTPRPALLRMARRQAGRVRQWAKFSPGNMSHRVSLLEAEEQWSRGRAADAVMALHRAIDQAGDAFLYQALGEARLAELLAVDGRAAQAQAAAGRARHAYAEWGARGLAGGGMAPARSAAGTVADSRSIDEIDRRSLLEATRALSSEVSEERLIDRLMVKVMQTARADRSLFISSDPEGRSVVQVVSTVGAEIERPRVPLDGYVALARPVVDLALRTGERVIVDDAPRDALLAGDVYGRTSGVRSVLASVVKVQNRTLGLIYLENHVASRAFSPSQIEVADALGAQAAIALENARLYQAAREALRAETELTQANRRFVPEGLLAGLGRASIVDVQLNEASEREVNVLFTDLRGFTRISRDLGPRRTVQLINRYLSHVQPGIAAHRGFVAQYYGDGILALFPGPAMDAIHGAIAMCRGLEAYNRERGDFPALEFGIGIHSGPVIIGTIGDPDHFQCGVVGDSVNVASRVEALTKHFAARLLVSGATVAQVAPKSASSCRYLGAVKVPGRAEPLDVYEAIDAHDESTRLALSGTLERFDAARNAYVQGRWVDAARLFESCLEACPPDAVSRAFRDRCVARVDRPASWDGVERVEKALG